MSSIAEMCLEHKIFTVKRSANVVATQKDDTNTK